MRKGKIHYIFFAALAIAGAALTACSSDDINKVEANQKGLDASKTYYMSVDATKGNNEATSRTNRALRVALDNHFARYGKLVMYINSTTFFGSTKRTNFIPRNRTIVHHRKIAKYAASIAKAIIVSNGTMIQGKPFVCIVGSI